MMYKTLTTEQIKSIIELHVKWLQREKGGVRADLSSADLSYADLSSANLRYADLSYADLSSADLRSANLRYADLSSADLSSANLSYADLSYADLRYADLSSANLSSANLPAPTMFLLANWGEVSDLLTTELMRYDADNHPEPKLFGEWAKGGECPYFGVQWQRCAVFEQKKELWKTGKCKMSALQLVEALFKEKDIKR